MSRAQTPHDYLIGVSLLLITLFGVFAFVPGMLQPFAQPVGADDGAAADRLGERLVSDHAYDGQQNTLNGSALADTLRGDTDGDFETLLDRAGINRSIQFVNVTVMQPDGTRVDDTWDRPEPESEYHVNVTDAASAVRVVGVEEMSGCDPVCRIVVRVW